GADARRGVRCNGWRRRSRDDDGAFSTNHAGRRSTAPSRDRSFALRGTTTPATYRRLQRGRNDIMYRVELNRIAIGIVLTFGAVSGWAVNGPCTQAAAKLQTACGNNADEEFRVTLAACVNLADADAQAQCTADARSARDDANSSCSDVNAARVQVCAALGDT